MKYPIPQSFDSTDIKAIDHLDKISRKKSAIHKAKISAAMTNYWTRAKRAAQVSKAAQEAQSAKEPKEDA